MVKKVASVSKNACVACGCCVLVCKLKAIKIQKGRFAVVSEEKCVGCGKCVKECPASVIELNGVKNIND